MKQTPIRTLLLLVGLFVVVVAHQSAAWTPAARASVMWLDDDPNEPLPESVSPLVWLDEDPNDPAEPLPESLGPMTWLDDDPNAVDDPNEPTEPLPETVAGMPFRSL
ncbi:MAG TPA: hypothetical protein PKH24_16420 [Sedimentisphaerales bacterium]|nr:hypothetical protein [Sedimentisphaerales bacterium]HNU31838.1 hypothetical protein [Sedimentisphaerales bacterium]